VKAFADSEHEFSLGPHRYALYRLRAFTNLSASATTTLHAGGRGVVWIDVGACAEDTIHHIEISAADSLLASARSTGPGYHGVWVDAVPGTCVAVRLESDAPIAARPHAWSMAEGKAWDIGFSLFGGVGIRGCFLEPFYEPGVGMLKNQPLLVDEGVFRCPPIHGLPSNMVVRACVRWDIQKAGLDTIAMEQLTRDESTVSFELSALNSMSCANWVLEDFPAGAEVRWRTKNKLPEGGFLRVEQVYLSVEETR